MIQFANRKSWEIGCTAFISWLCGMSEEVICRIAKRLGYKPGPTGWGGSTTKYIFNRKEMWNLLVEVVLEYYRRCEHCGRPTYFANREGKYCQAEPCQRAYNSERARNQRVRVQQRRRMAKTGGT